MEFDWEDTSAISEDCCFEMRDIEESFEDPFALRLLPDSERFSAQARYFNLGRSASGVGLFSVYRTNGKQFRVIISREFTEDEVYFYQRRLTQMIR